jgi:hypothetical protein
MPYAITWYSWDGDKERNEGVSIHRRFRDAASFVTRELKKNEGKTYFELPDGFMAGIIYAARIRGGDATPLVTADLKRTASVRLRPKLNDHLLNEVTSVLPNNACIDIDPKGPHRSFDWNGRNLSIQAGLVLGGGTSA